MKQKTLQQVLDSIEEFDGEMVIGGMEFQWGFVWSSYIGCGLTEEGKKQFAPLLNAPATITQVGKYEVIEVDYDIDTQEKEDFADLFVGGAAGYISCTLYDKWFT